MKKLLHSTAEVFPVNGVNYTEKSTDQPLIPDRSSFEVKMYVDKFKRYQPSSVD
jgi:hypothetical protein